DDVQYTKNDWRNRNRVKTAQGSAWLTIPVGTALDRRICDVVLADSRWAARHWKSLVQHYSKAPFFADYREALERVYLGTKWESLSALNQLLVRTIARDFLGMATAFGDSREYVLAGERLDRLLDLLSRIGATHYVSGPSAREYIADERFAQAGIELAY